MPMWMRRVANGLLAETIISSISAYVFSSSKSSTSSVSRTSSMQGQPERARHVPQRLDAGNHLNAQRVGVTDPARAAPPAKSARAGSRNTACPPPRRYPRCRQHRVVAHPASACAGRSSRPPSSERRFREQSSIAPSRSSEAFPARGRALVKPRGEHRQPAEEFGAASAANPAALRLRQQFQRPLFESSRRRETVFRERQVQIGRLRPPFLP